MGGSVISDPMSCPPPVPPPVPPRDWSYQPLPSSHHRIVRSESFQSWCQPDARTWDAIRIPGSSLPDYVCIVHPKAFEVAPHPLVDRLDHLVQSHLFDLTSLRLIPNPSDRLFDAGLHIRACVRERTWAGNAGTIVIIDGASFNCMARCVIAGVVVDRHCAREEIMG